MVLRCTRADDAAALVDTIDQAKVDSIGSLAKEDLLAEIAFKESNVPQSRSKNLAVRTCGLIEASFLTSQRSRLLGHAMFGLRSRKTRALMQERIKRWIFSRGLWGPGRIQGLRGWPATEHTWEVLYRALHDEDPGVIREASSVITHVFGGQIDRGNQLAQFALRSDNPGQRAACVESLSKGWPEHPLLPTVIAHARRSVSDTIKLASLVATVHLGKQEEPDLTELLGLARDDFTSTIDYFWRSEVAGTLARGWPGNPRLKKEFLHSAQGHYSRPNAIALLVLVTAFPQDDDVASLLAQELEQRSPFVGSDSIWPVLPSSFRDHPTVVQKLDQWVMKGDYHDPIALHHAALVGRTEKMKQALLDGINKWVPFWAVGSLLEGWGLPDTQVAEKLNERVARDDAAEVGQFVPQIVNDPTKARDKLLSLLRDPGSRRVDFLMRGFSQLRPMQGEAEIVDAALQRLGEPTSWTRENYQDSVILAFPKDERIRNLARDSLSSQLPPFAAVAEAYATDAELRTKLGELITPLSASLRYQIVSELARTAERDFVQEVLKDWDTERNAEVKTEAAIQFHSLLSMDPADVPDALTHLDALLPCYGPDHEARRQAAAAGLIVLKQLERVVGKTEVIGHVGRQVDIPVADGLKAKRVLLNLLGKHWNYVKQALSGNLNILAPSIGPDKLWENLALMAVEHPQLARDVFDVAETDLELRQSANFLALVGRMEPKSERLAQLCFAVIGDNAQRHEWFDSVEAASFLIAEHFEGDAKIEEQLVSFGSPHFIKTGAVMALSLGWPDNGVLRTIAAIALEYAPVDAVHLYAKYASLARRT